MLQSLLIPIEYTHSSGVHFYLLLQVEKLVPRSAEGRADKYCCVFLPDGTASLTPARPGLTVRNMLTGLCEKRGLPLSDIIIYLQGKDKVRSAKHLHVQVKWAYWLYRANYK